MKWVGSALGLALIVATGSSALAQPETEDEVQARLALNDFGRGGYYLGFEGFAAIENSVTIAGELISGGLDIRLGNRHNRWFATEVSGLYVHTYGDSEFLAWGMSLNGRFYPLRTRLQPFLTSGAGFLQLRSRAASSGFSPKFAMLFGVGLEIFATEDVVFTLQGTYHLPIGANTELDFVTAGAGMQFF